MQVIPWMWSGFRTDVFDLCWGEWPPRTEYEYLAVLTANSAIVYVVVRALAPLSTISNGPLSTVAKRCWPSVKQ